jgi:hypothetical protein
MPKKPSAVPSWSIVGIPLIALAIALAMALMPSQGAAQTAKTPSATAKVDLNNASAQELEELPGVGKATAKKIVAGRPYSSVADLSKAGVSKKTIDKLTPLVTVGAASTAATAAPPPVAKPPAKASTPKAGEANKSEPSVAKTPPAPGMVWVNTKSGVFHREGDRWYGKTKEGKFMTEADAVKAGYRLAEEGGAKKSGTAKQ